MNPERQPSQITTRQMIPLGTGLATLTLLRSHELLEFPVQLLDLPTHGVLLLNVVQSESSVGITRRVLILRI